MPPGAGSAALALRRRLRPRPLRRVPEHHPLQDRQRRAHPLKLSRLPLDQRVPLRESRPQLRGGPLPARVRLQRRIQGSPQRRHLSIRTRHDRHAAQQTPSAAANHAPRASVPPLHIPVETSSPITELPNTYVKFSFIGQVAEEQRQLPPGVRFPVVFMCRMLEVTRQGYYEWKKRPVSAHDQKDAELAARIRYLHQERHENRAGIERILWDLQEEGHVTSERRVRRLARAAGLQCVHPGPSARTTVQDSRAIGGLVDLVDRQFTAPEPDQLWVGDITYIWTYSGFAYLATLIDMCSNKVVGWAVDDHMRTDLVLEAVDNALAARGPGIGIGELVVHHDRGSQYTSGRYRDHLFAEGIIPSVGHTGICYDNAAAESFNATIKKELIYQHVWRDAGEVRTAVFDYIERYYNHVRKQRRLGKISPADYERQLDNWAPKAA